MWYIIYILLHELRKVIINITHCKLSVLYYIKYLIIMNTARMVVFMCITALSESVH